MKKKSNKKDATPKKMARKQFRTNLISVLNTKEIRSRFTDNLVYFTDEDITELSEEDILKSGYKVVSDTISMIDFEDNTLDDITQMYGILKRKYSDESSNLYDFFSEHGFFGKKFNPDRFLKELSKFEDRKFPIPVKTAQKEKSKKPVREKKKIKLLKGYAIEPVKASAKNRKFKLYRVRHSASVFTGLIAACDNEQEAIEIFNSHIPILGQTAILDQPVIIKKNR